MFDGAVRPSRTMTVSTPRSAGPTRSAKRPCRRSMSRVSGIRKIPWGSWQIYFKTANRTTPIISTQIVAGPWNARGAGKARPTWWRTARIPLGAPTAATQFREQNPDAVLPLLAAPARRKRPDFERDGCSSPAPTYGKVTYAAWPPAEAQSPTSAVSPCRWLAFDFTAPGGRREACRDYISDPAQSRPVPSAARYRATYPQPRMALVGIRGPALRRSTDPMC